jgi:hypothetical protein
MILFDLIAEGLSKDTAFNPMKKKLQIKTRLSIVFPFPQVQNILQR